MKSAFWIVRLSLFAALMVGCTGTKDGNPDDRYPPPTSKARDPLACTASVYFEDGSGPQMTTLSEGRFEPDIDCLRKSHGLIFVVGFAPALGGDESRAVTMSERYVKYVKERLVAQGIEEKRIQTFARGSVESPCEKGPKDGCKDRERRVEISVE